MCIVYIFAVFYLLKWFDIHQSQLHLYTLTCMSNDVQIRLHSWVFVFIDKHVLITRTISQTGQDLQDIRSEQMSDCFLYRQEVRAFMRAVH